MEWNEGDVENEIQKFKEDHIYPTIVNTEINEKSMMSWLDTLPFHSYDVREEQIPNLFVACGEFSLKGSNKDERYGDDHEKMEWNEGDVENEIQKFKEDHIYPTIVNTEINEKSMMSWLDTLLFHSYDVREEQIDKKTSQNDNKIQTTDPDDD